MVREIPTDGRAQSPGDAVVGRELLPLGGGAADEPLQLDVGIEVGRRNADTGGSASQAPFGLPYVGTSLQQRRAVSNGDECAQMRRQDATLHFHGRFGGRASQHGGKLEQGCASLSFERGNGCPNLGNEGQRSDYFEFRAGARFLSVAGDLSLVTDDVHGMMRDVELLAQGADLRVSACGFRGDRDSDDVACCDNCVVIGSRRLNRAAYASEKIDFV